MKCIQDSRASNKPKSQLNFTQKHKTENNYSSYVDENKICILLQNKNIVQLNKKVTKVEKLKK